MHKRRCGRRLGELFCLIAFVFSHSASASQPHLRSFRQIFVEDYLTQFIHYLVTAGLAFFIFYVLLKRRFIHRKIQQKFPKGSEIRREVLYSLSSIAVFSGVGLIAIFFYRMGWGYNYDPSGKYGWPYFWLSVAVLIFAHDTWFYWTHRFMHWRPIYRHVHMVHHQSQNPTPWAAFAFHPLEAFVESIYFPLVILLLPVNDFAILIWLLYMTTLNVFGHLGFELLPRGFARHWLSRWHNTSVHHNMHHKYFNCNYGLYFNIWDRLMNTNHVRYEDEYDELLSTRTKPRPDGGVPKPQEPV
ncbi:sterol desaturase family protein [soil metagenome]